MEINFFFAFVGHSQTVRVYVLGGCVLVLVRVK